MSWKIAPIGRGGDLLYSQAGTPALDLRFAEKKALTDYVSGDNLVTFTRASSATYVDSTGVLQTATTDTPRFDHDPTTGESLGLLVEESRANRATYSQNISLSTAWSGWEFNSFTVTQNAAVAPDGTTTATLLEDISTSGSRSIKNISMASVPSSIYTVSCFFKKATKGNTVTMIYNDSPYEGIYNFNFDNPSGNYIAYPNGWYRVWFTTTTARTNMNSVTINSGAVNGTSNTNVYLWGFQVEAGSFPTSYIPTSGATATRAADVVSITGTNFSSWYNQSEGTWFADVPNPGKVSSTRIINTGVNLWSGPTNAGYVRTSSSSVLSTTSYPAKVSAKYNDSSLTGAVNGILLAEAGGTNVPATYVDIGSANTAASGVGFINNPISRLTYWPVRLPDATLQTITT